LGTLLHLAGKDTTVILISDHGFHPDHLRPRILPNEPAGPAEEHRQFGIFVMAGPGIKQDELVFGANLLDIAPTVLTLFDLPTGRDMDGAPLATAWRQPPQWRLIDSWDDVLGDDGRHSAGKQIDPIDSHDAMQQLVELGYVERPDENQQVAVANTVRELRFNLARAYWGAGRVVEALAIFAELWHAWPDEHRFGVKALECCLKLERVAQARDILERIRRNKRSAAADAAKELKKLKARPKTRTTRPAVLSDQESRRLRRLERKAATNADTFHFLEGRLLHAEGKHADALRELEHAQGVQLHNQPDLYRTTGEVCLALRRWKRAEEAFRTMLEIDPINANARLGLAESLLPRRRFEEALQHATAAAGLVYHQPRAHFVAGLALARLGRYQEAASALHTAIAQNPVFPRAHRRLSRLYAGPLADAERAAHHRALEQQCRQRVADYLNGKPLPSRHDSALVGASTATLGQAAADEEAIEVLDDQIVVVSGLPRSGTSMMMQMLAAGGCPVLIDGHRTADDSNRRGYFEFEPAKRLATDTRWLEEAQGKAVKIVVQLLPHLPLHRRYRIVFMERKLSEVVASQRKMLKRLGRPGSRRAPAELARTYQKQVDAVAEILNPHSENAPVLSIDYAEALADPTAAAARVNRFLGGALDEAAMALAIEPALRNQTSP
jgi:tetratricopeptide (TPR) repeat protein